MPSHEEAIEKATLLMRRFAERTGLTSDRPTQRYLWTDALVVCNFLGLARLTGERSYADFALRLVDQVHHVLGRYRADDTRAGWISGPVKVVGSNPAPEPPGKQPPDPSGGCRFLRVR